MNKRGLATAAGAVEGFIKSQELAQALRPHLAKVYWEGVVGPQVAGVTQVEAVRDGVLFVRVKNSVWANELTLLKDDMVRRLNTKLGGRVLTDIHFKASGLAKSKKKPEAVRPAAPTDADLARMTLSKAAAARIEANLAAIADDTLRGRIRGIMLRAARTEEWKRRQGWPVCGRCGALSEPPPDPAPLLPNPKPLLPNPKPLLPNPKPLAADPKPLCAVCRAVVFGLGR